MTQEELYELIAEAEAGNVESMNKLVFIFSELSERCTAAGKIEPALNFLEQATKWNNELKRRGM